MNKALAKLGFKTTKLSTGLEKFRESLKDRVGEIMAERGYERDFKNEKRAHLEPAVFEATRELEKAEARTKELEEKADNLQTKITDIDKRESKVAEDEIEITRKNKKLKDDQQKLKDDREKVDADQKTTDDDRQTNINTLFAILRKLNPEKAEEQYYSVKELQDEVDAQFKKFEKRVDAVTDRETAVETRERTAEEKVITNSNLEKELNDLLKDLQGGINTSIKTMVFEAEEKKPGSFSPKIMRDDKGRPMRDAQGKVVLEPPRPLDEIVKEKSDRLDALKKKVEQGVANLNSESKESSYEY